MALALRKASPLRFVALFALAGLTALTTLGSGGCQNVDEEKKVELATHVSDWREEIIYQVLVDRFANGDYSNDFNVIPNAPARYHGGDWKGLEDRLDYVEALGVTTLWISPVVKNVETDAGVDGYHGYWAQDLTKPNPHFGDVGSLRRMIRKAHERGIKVVLDIVTNHLGQLFFYDINLNGQPDIQIAESGYPGKKAVTHITEYDPDFDPRGIQSFTSLGPAGPAPIIFVDDPAANKQPAFPAIFQEDRAFHRKGRIYDYDETKRRCLADQTKDCSTCASTPEEEATNCYDFFEQTVLGDFPGGLKDVATELPEVRAAMVDAYTRWVEETDLDGFRIDTLKHVEHGFWQTFGPAVRARLAAQGKQNFFMFGESFDGDDKRNGSYTRNQEVDSVFYFAQKYQVIDDVFKNHAATTKVKALWDQKAINYATEPLENSVGVAPNKLIVGFLDNHDVARFLFDKPDTEVLRNALFLLLTADGIPCIYYGTEQEFAGGNDPANREDLWLSGYSTANPTFQFIARMSRLRRGYLALTKGDTAIIWDSERTGDEADAGMLAYERTGGDAGDSYALVVINTRDDKEGETSFTDETGTAPMRTSLPAGTGLVDVLTGDAYEVGADGSLIVGLGPSGRALLVPQNQQVAGL
jgi:alpha-amylase